MEAMAAAGGVTKPILYRHFGDRQGLVTAIGERFLHDLDAAISASLQSRRAGDGSVLRATIDAYLSLVEQETELYRFLVQQAARSGERTSAFVVRVVERVTQLIEGALRNAGRDPAPAELWAVGTVGMVHTVGDWWAEGRTSMSRSAVVDELTDLLWHGLESAATSHQPRGDE